MEKTRMDRRFYAVLFFVILVTTLDGSAAQVQRGADYDREVSQRIAVLSERLRFSGQVDQEEVARRFAEFPTITTQLNQVIDSYVRAALTTSEGSQQIQARLRSL